MFLTRKRYEEEKKYMEASHDRLNNLYWDLYRKHDRLLKKLGLSEQIISETVLVAKGEPERGDG